METLNDDSIELSSLQEIQDAIKKLKTTWLIDNIPDIHDTPDVWDYYNITLLTFSSILGQFMIEFDDQNCIDYELQIPNTLIELTRMTMPC